MMQALQSGKRKFGMAGLDHSVIGRATKARRQVMTEDTLSIGRHAPVFPQSIIVQTGVMSLPPESDVPNPHADDIMAPRGDLSLMIPKCGEWACKFNTQEDRHNTAHLGVARIDTTVFTCGNGVPKNYQLIFVGIVTNAQDLLNGNRDEVGALDIGGTVTGINYGPERIAAGDFVYIGLPHMIDSIVNGQTVSVPGVRCAGMPANKAHFGTYRLRWNTVSAGVTDMRNFVDEEYAKRKAAGTEEQFTATANMRTMVELQRNTQEEVPLFQYACIYAHQVRCNDIIASLSDVNVYDAYASVNADRIREFNEFTLYLQKIDTKHNAELVKYDVALGYPPDHHELNKLQSVRKLTNAATKAQLTALLMTLQPQIDRLKEITVELMHNFLRQRLMGKALCNSDPGQQLDINLGYFPG